MISQETTKYYPVSEWADLYVDYVNNFMTVERWAEYYQLSSLQANDIIETGRTTDNFSKPFTF